jgi:hypothetical protein
MPRLLRLAAVAGALLSSAAAHADEVRDHRGPAVAPATATAPAPAATVRYRRRPGPGFMMPLKLDLGAAGAHTSRGMAEGVGGSIGIHWASLSPEPTDLDVGVGVFGAILAARTDTTVMNDHNGAAYGGAYLEGGHTLSRGDWWRTWAAVRGEYLSSTAFGGVAHHGLGVAGRLSAELYSSGVGIEPRGLFLGTYSIGVYAEVGVRDTAAELGAVHVSAGLTFRTPLVFAP